VLTWRLYYQVMQRSQSILCLLLAGRLQLVSRYQWLRGQLKSCHWELSLLRIGVSASILNIRKQLRPNYSYTSLTFAFVSLGLPIVVKLIEQCSVEINSGRSKRKYRQNSPGPCVGDNKDHARARYPDPKLELTKYLHSTSQTLNTTTQHQDAFHSIHRLPGRVLQAPKYIHNRHNRLFVPLSSPTHTP
jgi:hypothetical protein